MVLLELCAALSCRGRRGDGPGSDSWRTMCHVPRRGGVTRPRGIKAAAEESSVSLSHQRALSEVVSDTDSRNVATTPF